jgi:hypothetical protein
MYGQSATPSKSFARIKRSGVGGGLRSGPNRAFNSKRRLNGSHLVCGCLSNVQLLALFACIVMSVLATTLVFFADIKQMIHDEHWRHSSGSSGFKPMHALKKHMDERNEHLSVPAHRQPAPENLQSSPFAYVTLMSGIDNTFRYRGFLYNCLVMAKALRDSGSRADFIVMIGFSGSEGPGLSQQSRAIRADIDLLRKAKIILHELPRLLSPSDKLTFAEMALLKITPYSFTQYERIQFLDGDIMPLTNMDCFFDLSYNTFTVGMVSPVNSGWYVGIPDSGAYTYMREKAVWRLREGHWDEDGGWAREKIIQGAGSALTYRDGKRVQKWKFNGADMDQGLFTHYFILSRGKALLVNAVTKTAYRVGLGLKHLPSGTEPVPGPLTEHLGCCGGISPLRMFAHFTGRGKPWMLPLKSMDLSLPKHKALKKWCQTLDELKVPLNCSMLDGGKDGGKAGGSIWSSPLGFFNSKYKKKNTEGM